jgi:hypothetical protein
MVIGYWFKSRAGMFKIQLQPDRRWHAVFEDENRRAARKPRTNPEAIHH